ncbi:MAG: hypothetical protein ACI4AA_03560 [Lachnospiraceae bacterium]
MQVTYSSKYFRNAADTISFISTEIDECPICKKAIKPVLLNMTHTEKSAPYTSHGQFLCMSCKGVFVADYGVTTNATGGYKSSDPTNIAPNRFVEMQFDESIKLLSPQFVKIYNQALAAETSGLDEIAGLGYRKALEFLIKDFAIHEYPENTETIKKMLLSPCIQKYIDDDRIKTLAERSVWIGNDEAHYIRKQEDRDVNDMKSFIKATVYFISMVLITEDAATIAPAK